MTSSDATSPWPPPRPADEAGRFSASKPPHETLPLAAGVGAVVVLAVSLLVSKLLLDAVAGQGWPIVVYVVLVAAVGYGPSIAWLRHASRRWGSGKVLADVGVTPRWSDLGWGPLVWLAAVATQVATAVVVLALDVPISNNTDGIDELTADRAYVVAIVITAVVAAPLVEEMVFRGLVLRSLLSRLPVWVAIALQGLLFGAAHVDPVRGAGNVGLVIVLGGVGVAFGGFAYLLRRTSATIVAHAVFNGVVMVLVLTGVADRLREENDPFASGVLGARPAAEEIAVVDQADVPEPHRSGDPRRAR